MPDYQGLLLADIRGRAEAARSDHHPPRQTRRTPSTSRRRRTLSHGQESRKAGAARESASI